MRAAILAFHVCFLTALPLAAQENAALPRPTEPIASHVYLGTQADQPLISEVYSPKLQKVWQLLTDALRKSDVPGDKTETADTINRSYLLQW